MPKPHTMQDGTSSRCNLMFMRYSANTLSFCGVQALLLLDADFLVSKGVHEALTATDKASALMDDLTANKRVIVLPAFETPRSLSEDTGRTYALEAQACEWSSCWCFGMCGPPSDQFQPLVCKKHYAVTSVPGWKESSVLQTWALPSSRLGCQ